jgi:hypothetical protein
MTAIATTIAMVEEITRLRAELDGYHEAAQYDATMAGPVFKGWNRSTLDRARRVTEANRADTARKPELPQECGECGRNGEDFATCPRPGCALPSRPPVFTCDECGAIWRTEAQRDLCCSAGEP